MNLHCHHYQQIHDRDRRETKDETVGFAVAVELLSHREHLHAAVDERRHREEASADHGDHQVADVVSGKGEEAKERRDDTEQVGVLPLVRHGHLVMG